MSTILIFLPFFLKTEAMVEINHAKEMQVDTDLLDSRQVRKAQGDRNQVLVTRFNLDLVFKSLAICLYLFHNWKRGKGRRKGSLSFLFCAGDLS